MNVKRFTARSSREALALVKQAFGDDAVVMSTRPCPQGVEVVAMAPDSVDQLERVGAAAEWVQAPERAPSQPAARQTSQKATHQTTHQPSRTSIHSRLQTTAGAGRSAASFDTEPDHHFDDELPSWASTGPAAAPAGRAAPSRLESAARLLSRARQRMEPVLEPALVPTAAPHREPPWQAAEPPLRQPPRPTPAPQRGAASSPAYAPSNQSAPAPSLLGRVMSNRGQPAQAWSQDSQFDAHQAAAGSAQHQSVQGDVAQLEMSTLSFQDYVRQRMLKRREAEMAAEAAVRKPAAQPQPPTVSAIDVARRRQLQNQALVSQPASLQAPLHAPQHAPDHAPVQQTMYAAARSPAQPRASLSLPSQPLQASPHRQATPLDMATLPVLRDEVTLEQLAQSAAKSDGDELQTQQPLPTRQPISLAVPTSSTPSNGNTRRDQTEMMSELRSMRGLIEQRFGALAFMEKLQRQPRQAQLAQRLLAAGFSPALIRRLVDGLPVDVEEQSWAATVLERNLVTAQTEPALEEQGGIYAVIGATGVGKTTSTAKLAAAFAARYGAANLGLITLDAYRVGAHEQLRTYGRILGVPVHTAHDRASLEDLLELLSAKRMILIDTAGMAQRDSRTRELLEMVSHGSIKRLLVINASAQGETIEDQLAAYAAQHCSGVVLSKLDEAVKLGPALDSMVRHKLKVVAVANGQRVPEDWHRLSANALVQRALKGGGSAAWKLNDNDVNLIFAGMPMDTAAPPRARVAATV